MRVAVFSAKPYDEQYLGAAFEGSNHQLDFFEAKLNCDTVPLAASHDAVCVFVHDEVNGEVLRKLAEGGTRLVVLRAAGFNNVNLDAGNLRNGSIIYRQPGSDVSFTLEIFLKNHVSVTQTVESRPVAAEPAGAKLN